MASVVSNRRGGWEIRESHSTPDGPRSRTLATFRVLDGGVLDHAEERAEQPFDREDVVRSAYRAGAEVSPSRAEAAARTLITELSEGAVVQPGLAGAIVGLLEKRDPPTLSFDEMEASRWAGRSMKDRGRALHDLLLFVDAVPTKPVREKLGFPRLVTR
jgi:hypothetical protein